MTTSDPRLCVSATTPGPLPHNFVMADMWEWGGYYLAGPADQQPVKLPDNENCNTLPEMAALLRAHVPTAVRNRMIVWYLEPPRGFRAEPRQWTWRPLPGVLQEWAEEEL